MNGQGQIKDLSEFLAKHNAKNDKNAQCTHTRIGDKELNIFSGSYSIPQEDLPTFYKLYYDHVFVKKKREYLTEKQMDPGGMMAVDFDFRYSYDIEERLHSKEHIQDMVLLYLEELKQYFIFEEDKSFDIYIFEKPTVNRLEEKVVTKDGIHMMIGIQIDHTIQMMIREKIVEKIPEIWDMPLTNSWESVLDEGISKGTTNWQLFGSRKPGNDAYEFTQHFVITYDKSDGEFMMDEKKVEDFDLKNEFYKLSVQNKNNPKFELNPKIIETYKKRLENKNHKIKRPPSKTKVNLLVDEDDDDMDNEMIPLNEITNKEILKKAVDIMLKSLRPDEYKVKETHMYAQTLPEKYYAPGSHLLNRQVAFALKHTDERLFLSWVQLRSKAFDFDYSTIPALYHDWKKYFINKKEQPITGRSIMYWAKQDAYDEYVKVKESTIDYYIEETIYSPTDFDLANVLYHVFKDKYICIGYENKGIWYVFRNHRWEPDKGISLRLAISKDLYNIYDKKRDLVMEEHNGYDPTDERREFLSKKSKALSDICTKFKRTSDKNNIMREAMELFFDSEFVKCMDTNKHLLCFMNGVIDFKHKIFRDGYPQDYITKTTGIYYKEYNPNDKSMVKIGNELISFMEKLFPIPDLNKYMWDHLSSCLIGGNMNQTFNIYHGSGSNGKSILTDLMSHALGEYKGIVPITLVTEKRNGIGGTSSELIQLKGVRYAVMQEPTKSVKLNEGVMKELTGGDPLQARALFQESETFETQFKLVVCTNNLFDIESNDDGTWRRIRKCDFLSKFVDETEKHREEGNPYVFPKDKSLKERLPDLAPVFASMLVKRAFETNGIVEDCDYVLSASNKYRKGQDHIAAFVSERVVKVDDNTKFMQKRGLYEEFKMWFQQEQGMQRIPKGQELYDFMDKKFGAHKKNGWSGVDFVRQEEKDELDIIQDGY